VLLVATVAAFATAGLTSVTYDRSHDFTDRATNPGFHSKGDVDTHNKGVVERGTSIGITFTYKNPSMMPIWPYLAGSGATSATFVEEGSGTTHNLTCTLADNGLPKYVAGFGTRDFYASCETMPNYVTKGTLSWGLYFSDGFSTYYTMPNQTIYYLEDAPAHLMAIPWLEVLDDATSYAQGESGANDVAEAVTFGLYWDPTTYYDPSSDEQYSSQPIYNGTDMEAEFYLTDLYGARSGVSGNCVDFANWLTTLLESVGLDASTDFLVENSIGFPVTAGFTTNLIAEIGMDATSLANYSHKTWAYHATATRLSSAYDACLALWTDLSGGGYANPPTGWSLAGYWQTPYSSGYYGLTHKQGTVAPIPGASSLAILINLNMDLTVI
jgi:hypothetical protein